MINGVVLQRKTDSLYKGIEGDNWYLNGMGFEEFDVYYSENIEKAWYDEAWFDACTDIGYIQKYVEFSLTLGIDYRILLCETEKRSPIFEERNLTTQFLGYDYAYSGGSYYSAVLNDVISGRIVQFSKYHLNRYGLFQDKESVLDFASYRDELARMSDSSLLEKGDFVIIGLYEICNW